MTRRLRRFTTRVATGRRKPSAPGRHRHPCVRCHRSWSCRGLDCGDLRKLCAACLSATAHTFRPPTTSWWVGLDRAAFRARLADEYERITSAPRTWGRSADDFIAERVPWHRS